MILTACTEDMIRELANGVPVDQIVPELARRIVAVEGVRKEVERLAHERRAEEQRHRDALAANAGELGEWQAECPHPCPTIRDGPMPGDSYRECLVCGKMMD